MSVFFYKSHKSNVFVIFFQKVIDKKGKRCYTNKVAFEGGNSWESTKKKPEKKKKGEKKYLTKERQSDIIDKLSKGAAVMFEN